MNAIATAPARSVDAVVVLAGARRPDKVLRALRAHGLEVARADSVGTLARNPPARCAPVLLLLGAKADTRLLRVLASARRLSSAHVVLVCDAIAGREARAAVTAGAAGVILASDVSTALLPCLQAVLAGQICMPQETGHLERPTLSWREKQVLALVVMGYMNGEIAERLFLAQSTVKSHLTSAFAKLGVRSRHEAVDLILDPEGGLSTGILALGAERVTEGTAPHAGAPA